METHWHLVDTQWCMVNTYQNFIDTLCTKCTLTDKGYWHSETSYKHSVTSYKHSVTSYKHSVTSYKHSVTSYKHSVTSYKHSVRGLGRGAHWRDQGPGTRGWVPRPHSLHFCWALLPPWFILWVQGDRVAFHIPGWSLFLAPSQNISLILRPKWSYNPGSHTKWNYSQNFSFDSPWLLKELLPGIGGSDPRKADSPNHQT